MGKLPIVQKDETCRSPDGDILPTWYMGDYSVLAIVVDDKEAAARVLQDKGIPVIEGSGGTIVEFDAPAGLNQIVAHLTDSTLQFSLSDSATRIYQG
ncbi:hypothetical protein D3OALGA1CA_835 [Olavius algarvensis associated proteobacterium Delta 3]|nr:hypothetical protein D3OALGA1CA_835 [Olavius algarvensis associated proteobacterium Delta 3]CAB5142884.1 hypothetical protein D3OALGB2SA_4339 [Olavius algarvensis associated proteobacterium Delta 3]